MNRPFAYFLAFLMTASFALGQTAAPKKPATHVPAKAAPATAKPATPPAGATTVTAAEVDSFMKHMFGQEPAAQWKVLDISSAESPGVTRVVVSMGDQPQVLYVMPGGKFAMVGEVIPWGADPFAPVRTRLQAEAKGPVLGNKDAPVLLVEFSDLQCPHCKLAQPVIEKLLAESPNARLVYQPFPLPMHPWAMKAAQYAECVSEQDGSAFWKFLDGVYAAQADITEANADEKLDELVKSVGANAARVATCSALPATAARIQKSFELGRDVGVNSTPTLYIEGRKVQTLVNEALPTLKAMIDFEAAQKAGTKAAAASAAK